MAKETKNVFLGTKALLDDQAEDGSTPLIRAAKYGHDEVVEALLAETGLDPDVRDRRGRTALHLAAANGKGKAVQALLAAGADRGLKDNDGFTAEKIAKKKGHDLLARLIATTSQGQE